VAESPVVVWVREEPPDRNLGGGSIRAAHLVTALAARVPTALVLGGHLQDEETRAALVSVQEVPVTRPVSRNKTEARIRDLTMAFGAGPREVYENRRTRRLLRPFVQPWADRARIVITSHQSLMPMLVPKRTGFWYTEIQHVSAEMSRQSRVMFTGRRQQWLVDRETAQAARLEEWAVRNYDGVIACAEEDIRLLSVPAGKVVLAPNGVDVDRYRATPLPSAPNIILPASLNYLPNVDGAIWFCDNVWDRVRHAVPDAHLDLVGRLPVPQVRALGERPGVAVQADVPSMAPWLEQSRLVVVPLRVGTGSRLKVVEAMASGRAVVGTSIGLDGLGLVDGEHALFADEPAAMADAIVRLLRDDAESARLAKSGRELVEGRFRWDRIADKFAEDVLALAGV
jgi:glycosyltransferase involved in cell wall biosynthesis